MESKVVALQGDYFPQHISPSFLTAFRYITSVGSQPVPESTSEKSDLVGDIYTLEELCNFKIFISRILKKTGGNVRSSRKKKHIFDPSSLYIKGVSER